MHMVATLRLVSDVIRAGLRASDLSDTQQQLWVQATVLADEPKDAAALLSAGFAVGAGELRAIKEKALRSQAWKNAEMRL